MAADKTAASVAASVSHQEDKGDGPLCGLIVDTSDHTSSNATAVQESIKQHIRRRRAEVKTSPTTNKMSEKSVAAKSTTSTCTSCCATFHEDAASSSLIKHIMSTLFAQPQPKKHALFQTPVFRPIVYLYIDVVVEGIMVLLSCFMVQGTAQKVMGIGSAVHAVLIFLTDYQASQPSITLFNNPMLNMAIMHVYDWGTVVAIGVLPWLVDGFDAVLPKWFYTLLAVILAPALVFLDPAPTYTTMEPTLSDEEEEEEPPSSPTMTPQQRRRSSILTDFSPLPSNPTTGLRLTETVLRALHEELSLDDQQEATELQKLDDLFKQQRNLRDPTVHVFVALNLVVFMSILWTRDYASEGPLTQWLYFALAGSVATTIFISRIFSVTTKGEQVMLTLLLSQIWLVSCILMYLIASPCVNCGYLFTSQAAAGSSEYSPFEADQHAGWRFWQLLLKEADDDNMDLGADIATRSCRQCIQGTVSLFAGGWSFPSLFFGPASTCTGAVIQRQPIQELPVEDHPIEQDTGDLATWYFDFANQTRTRDLKTFNGKVLETLARQGHLSGEELAGALEEYLCSPASRFDQPDPTTFLADIKNARFTGEDSQSVNLTASKLQRIMRGDILKELGVSVCFMLRFTLLLEDDAALESRPISHTTLAPTMNEESMQVHYANYEVPGIVLPQVDQDIDPDGSQTKMFKTIMDLFVQLPYEDPTPVYFETKEEYLAFYRWELESSVQDDWFFSKWLLRTEKKHDMIDLMATKATHSDEHLILEDPTSDQTMSDRSFYGSGQMFLTPIKLPGLDDDHDFQFPLTADSFPSDQRRDAHRYTKKPSEKQLLEMVKQNYPTLVTEKSMMRDWKDAILQIDFSILEALEGRPDFHDAGSILYIDVKTRTPIGIWMTTKQRIFLPNEGRAWEHAKWYHRVGERAVLTAHHVQESHFAWSQSLANAALQTLPRDHAIRVLVKPYTLNAHSVNSAAYNMLVRDHGILTHGAGLTAAGVTAAFHTVYAGLDYSETVPDRLDAHGLDGVIDTSNLPLFSQGKRLYITHRRFVDNFVTSLYPTDQALLDDDSVMRFWHHVNTQGRHTDPCVCDMSSDLFFEDDHWPAFEMDHTCAQLLDFDSFLPDKNLVTRRQRWCRQDEKTTEERLQAFYLLLEKECVGKKNCKMMYDHNTLRNDMGLQQLTTRSQFIDFLATAIWQITAGHEFSAENISYFADPSYAGVRLREYDNHGEPPLKVDVGTYVWGTSIASLTTVRGPPLLADWSPLYSFYASSRKDLSSKERIAVLERLNQIHLDYKFELVDLSKQFLTESIARRPNQRSNVFVPAVQTSSVCV